MTYSRDQWAWRKQDYRRRIGSVGRARRNVEQKKYQKTPRGIFALRVAAINNNCRYRGYKGKIFASDLLRVFYALGGDLNGTCPCAICGQSSPWPSLVWDHRHPLRAGGKNEASNMQLIHRDCHKHKTAMEQNAMSAFGRGVKYVAANFVNSQQMLKLDAI
jgi:5-methylcytosine-specific restriction endonuclease McrA